MMQYILSEEEYKALKAEQKRKYNITTKRLQELCTKIANEMPIEWGWNGPDPKPWGCVLTEESEWYCDDCPVRDICPSNSKEWSK